MPTPTVEYVLRHPHLSGAYLCFDRHSDGEGWWGNIEDPFLCRWSVGGSYLDSMHVEQEKHDAVIEVIIDGKLIEPDDVRKDSPCINCGCSMGYHWENQNRGYGQEGMPCQLCSSCEGYSTRAEIPAD